MQALKLIEEGNEEFYLVDLSSEFARNNLFLSKKQERRWKEKHRGKGISGTMQFKTQFLKQMKHILFEF